MRLDIYLSKIGLIKRRTIAKELAEKGHIKLNNNRAKPSKDVKISDIVSISGNQPVTIEVIELPSGSVRKEEREKYYRLIE